MPALALSEPSAIPDRAGQRPLHWRLKRRHALMLALAAEVLVMGAHGAERYSPPGIAVEMPATKGHVIT